MKANNIIKKLIAPFVLLAALFTGCAQEELVPSLDGLNVEPSYLSLAKEGSSIDVLITAKESWTISNLPEWLTVSKTSGEATPEGVKVTFSALKAYENLNAEVIVSSGALTKIVKVEQLVGAPAPTSTKDFMEKGVDGKVYVVQGITGVIENDVYGNFYLNDGSYDGSGIYVYGMLDANGQTKNFLSLGVEEGDEIIISGLRKTYKGKVEIENAVLVKMVKKALVGVKEKFFQLGNEAGKIEVPVVVKGETVSVSVPEEYDWMHYEAVKGSGVDTKIVISYSENASSEPREGKFVVKSTKAGKGGKVDESSVEITILQLPADPAVKTVSEVDFRNGEYVQMTGAVVALTKEGFILGDGSANTVNKVYVEVPDFVYRAYKPGYKVRILGVANSKYACNKIIVNVIETVEKTTVDYVAPEKVIDKSNAGSILTQKKADVEYYKVTGFVNGDGAIMLADSKEIIEAQSPIDEIDLRSMTGKYVSATGYYIDNNSRKNIMKFVINNLEPAENAPEYFKLPKTSQYIDWNELSASFEVVSNVAWTASLPEAVTGVKLSATSGKGSKKIYVNFDSRNDSYSKQQVDITFTYTIEEQEKTASFKLSRDPKVLKLEGEEALISPDAQQYTLTVTASRFWKVISLPEGVTADKMEGLGTDGIVLSIPAATLNERKELVVTVAEDRVDDPAQEATFKFTQRAANEKESEYVKATEVVAGQGYILYVEKGVFTLPSKNYGNASVTPVDAKSGVIKTWEALDEFELIPAEGGFKIKFAKKGFMYMKGTYDNFNFNAAEQTEGDVWSFELNSDGTVKVLNTLKNKYIQWESKKNFGSYSAEKGDIPVLFKKK